MKHIIAFILLCVTINLSSQTYTTCPGQSITIVASNTANLSNPGYSLNPGGLSSVTGSFVVGPQSSTTYTAYVTGTNSNNVIVTNISTFTVTVPVSSGFFSLTSPNSFTLGCSSKSITSVSILQMNVPPLSVYSYSFLPPWFFGTLPQGPLGAFSTATINAPGTWTAAIKENGSGCVLLLPFAILSNTIQPPMLISVPNNTLTCFQPSLVLQTSSAFSATAKWEFIGLASPIITPSIQVNTSTVSGQTVLNTYTLTLTDSDNLCKTSTVVPVSQNIMPPKANIAGLQFVTCPGSTVVLTNVSVTQIPPIFNPTLFVSVVAWLVPAFQPSSSASTYSAYLPGTYTMVVVDNNNGCTANATYVVGADPGVPLLNQPATRINLCPGFAVLTATINPLSSAYTYSWSAPNSNGISAQANGSATVTLPGTYTLAVTNSVGCIGYAFYAVDQCVGINEVEISSVKIFPVPARHHLYIENYGGSDGKWTVFDLTGAAVLAGVLSQNKNEINIEGLREGVYFLRISNGAKKDVYKKIVVAD